MKRFLVVLVALCAAVAVAAPAFAVDFKYGGMYRLRWQNNENVADGDDDGKDDENWFDQRLRMYFTFVGSENLQVVTKWEADTAWGHETDGRHGGGDLDADATNLEMKNVYLDFNIPNTPVRATMGVQGLVLMDGWMFNHDFSGAVFRTDFDPIGVTVGYIAAINEEFDESQDMDDFFLELKYDGGSFYGALTGLWQHARDNQGATNFRGESSLQGRWEADDISYTRYLDGVFDTFSVDEMTDNDLFNLGATVGYKTDWMNAKVNFIKNFGSYDYEFKDGGDSGSGDYKGWMVEALSEFYWQDFTFTLGGFYTSGDDDDDDDADYFVYPAGREHYWSEILGNGTLDRSVFGVDADSSTGQGAYYAADHPTNLWMLTAGTSWQALEGTKVTFNYYYVMTSEDVVADYSEDGDSDMDDTVGHEVDFYLDQDVVDGLQLRLVGAYLFADDAYKANDDDDDAYEMGAQLLWQF